jgi:hypothetical protein
MPSPTKEGASPLDGTAGGKGTWWRMAAEEQQRGQRKREGQQFPKPSMTSGNLPPPVLRHNTASTATTRRRLPFAGILALSLERLTRWRRGPLEG